MDGKAQQQQLLNRPAVRFLWHHREADLVTRDPSGDREHISRVRYAPDSDGGFLTHLPTDSEHAHAIRNGGVTELRVMGESALPVDSIDESGLLTAGAIDRVHATVSARLLDRPFGLASRPTSPDQRGEMLLAGHDAEVQTITALRLSIRNLQVGLRAGESD